MDGLASIDFGSVALNGAIGRIFVIRNIGTADLTGLLVTIDGVDAGLFESDLGSGPVAVGESVSFTVHFSPMSLGPKTAELHITSDDADESPFDIVVSGNGVAADALFDAVAADAGLVGPDAALEAEPFGDGVSNLLKYAFNLDLSGPDSSTMDEGGGSGLPGGMFVEEGGQTFWRVEFVVRKGSGLIYTPQFSTTLDPGSFVPMTGAVIITDIDGAWQRVSVDEPFDSSVTPVCFSNVAVTLP